MKKVLVTGATGQLGRELADLFRDAADIEGLFVGRDEIPLNEPAHIEERLSIYHPDIIVHAGAYTAVDLAESESELANNINHLAAAAIGRFAHERGIKLIAISTDYVFDGQSSHPLTEDARVAPINVYGKTKLLGEMAILAACPDAVVIRTSWVYSVYGKNFVKTMRRLMTEREEIAVIDDQIGSPTYAKDLANAISTIVRGAHWVPGIFHYSNEGKASWHEFALAIRDITGLSCEIKAITTAQYPTAAKRPRYSLLNKDKIRSVYGVEVPFWKDSLKVCLGEVNE